MPVVFRCFYCRGKLSIAKRKAGQDVACPRCQAIITVPVPDDLGNQLTELLTASNQHAVLGPTEQVAEHELAPANAGYDLDDAAAAAFDGDAMAMPPPPPAPVPKPPPPMKKPAPKLMRTGNDMPLFEADEIEQLLASKIGPEPLPEPAREEKEKVGDFPSMVTEDAFVISRAKATLLMIGAVLAVGMAFAAGFVVRGW
jgi:phage FluMu protein Com